MNDLEWKVLENISDVFLIWIVSFTCRLDLNGNKKKWNEVRKGVVACEEIEEICDAY